MGKAWAIFRKPVFSLGGPYLPDGASIEKEQGYARSDQEDHRPSLER